MDTAKRLRIVTYVYELALKGAGNYPVVLLPVLYTKGLISGEVIGVAAATAGLFVIATSILIPFIFRRQDPKKLTVYAFILSIMWLPMMATYLWAAPITLILYASFALIGIFVGLSSTANTTLKAEVTSVGDRFSLFANTSIASDLLRISLPLLLIFLSVHWDYRMSILLQVVFVSVVGVIGLVFIEPANKSSMPAPRLHFATTFRNIPLRYRLMIEFFDSIASAQLFVYIPLLIQYKGYEFGTSFAQQAVLFGGYLAGRLVVSKLAYKIGGERSVLVSEIAMIFCIIALLFANNILAISAIVFTLGIFGRGTSPVIKAFVFDVKTKNSNQDTAAAHMVFGDGGNAISSLSFGLLLAYFGPKAPFIASIVVLIIVSVLIFRLLKRAI